MGAMENKGLNVFNTAYVLADQKTASDGDYERVEVSYERGGFTWAKRAAGRFLLLGK